jgi:hypothetical protein
MKKSTLQCYGSTHTFTRINSSVLAFHYSKSNLYKDIERAEAVETIGGKRIIQSSGFFDCDRDITIEAHLTYNQALDLRDARLTRKLWTFTNWYGYTKNVRFAPEEDGLIIDFDNAINEQDEWMFRVSMRFMVVA